MLNLDAINEISEDLEKNSKGGTSFLNQKDLPEEMDFRLIDPRPNMKGIFFVIEKAIWINKVKYISPESIGESCVMQAIINEALAKNDPDLTTLVKRLCYQNDLDKLVSLNYHVPMLKMSTDQQGNILDIPESNPVTLQCTTMMFKRLLKLVAHRNYRGVKDGVEYYITDPKHGYNITLSKKKKNDRVEYDAIAGKQVEIADTFYDPEKLPNPVYNTRKQMYSDAYLKSVMMNYLYGEPLMEKESRFSEQDIAALKADVAPVVKKAEPKAEAKKPTAKVEPNVEPTKSEPAVVAEKVTETPAVEEVKAEEPVAATETSTDKAPVESRSIEDDLDDLD